MHQSTAGPSTAAGSSTNGVAGLAQASPSQGPSLDLPALQTASRVLQEQYVKDAQIVPELGDMLTIRAFRASYIILAN